MKKIIVTIITTLFSVAFINAQTIIRVKQFNLEKGLAIQGYDPVAYFILNKAMEGKENISAVVEGVTYYFTTTANRDLFLKDFKKYEPQYGGWCAYAMGKDGTKVDVDPKTYKVIEGKLYLFYNKFFNNTLNKWNQDEVKLKSKADQNWVSKHNNK